MHALITVVLLAFLSSLVVFGFVSVLRALLERGFGESPLVPDNSADARAEISGEPLAANPKTASGTSATTIAQCADVRS
jgi:hypothetical protein